MIDSLLRADFIPSGTRLAQEYPKMFPAWCEHVRPTRNGSRSTHSGTQGKSGPCVQRELTGRAIIVIVIERVTERKERKRDEKRQKKGDVWEEIDTWEKRDRHEKRGRDGESGSDLRNAPVCTFKTPVSHKTRAFGSFLNVHTGAFFSARQEETHTPQQHAQPNTPHNCEQNTLTPRIFSHICTHFILVHMHRMAQGVAARVSWKHTFIHMPPRVTQNEEYCPVAIQNPLTGYEPNVLDDFHYLKTSAIIFQDESDDIDTERSNSCDEVFDDELVGKALSSPLFIQEREESANWKQAKHSHEESLLPVQSFFTRTSTVRPVYEPSSDLSQKRESSRDLENERTRILSMKDKKRTNSRWF